MTSEKRLSEKGQVFDAWRAGYITAVECDKRITAIEKAYYDAKHGEFDVSLLPGGDV